MSGRRTEFTQGRGLEGDQGEMQSDCLSACTEARCDLVCAWHPGRTSLGFYKERKEEESVGRRDIQVGSITVFLFLCL